MQKLLKCLSLAFLFVASSVLTSSVHAASSKADLTVALFALTDKAGHVKTTFAPNEPIYARFAIKNSGSETAYNQYTSSGFLWSQIYGNKPQTVTENTGSDISVWTRNQNNIKPNQVVTYDSTPTGTNSVAYEGQNTWTKSATGSYTARVFVNYDHLALESNYTNNQATIVYKIGTFSQATPTPTLKPTATPTPKVTVTPSPKPTSTPVPPSDHIIASCTNGTVNLSFPALPSEAASWAIRIDNTINGWGGDAPLAGDAVVNGYTGNSYSFKTNQGQDVTWWVHSISSTGVYSDPTIGQMYCAMSTPSTLSYSHDGSNYTLRWSNVTGAVKYAIRVDDTTNGWNATNLADGDHLRNDLTDNSYTFKPNPGHKIVWWVHAIDSKGRYSNAAIASFMRPISSPTGLSASYSWPYATLKWSAVSGAKYYAIRADNQMNGWNDNTMNEGDHKEDKLTETEFKVDIAPGRKLVWWVHAVDSNGNYTDPTIQEYYVPGN
ncbi:hypothetical protein BH09PAT1_BH09PAT1_5250 [soil metagenome]